MEICHNCAFPYLGNISQFPEIKNEIPRHLAEYSKKSKIRYSTSEKMCYNTDVWLKVCSIDMIV